MGLFSSSAAARVSGSLLTWTACGLIAAAACILHARFMVPNHDNDWLLIAAERMLAGGHYWVDFIEINPPLIVILNIPPVILAHLTGTALYTGFSLYVAGLILLSAALFARWLRTCLDTDRGLIGLALVGYVGILALEPGYEFGQREHLFVILFTPGLLWFAMREAGYQPAFDVPALVAIVLAAIAVLIKPFFLLVVAVLVLLRCRRLRDWRAIADPFVAIIAVMAALYAAVIVLWQPQYLEEAALGSEVYFAWNRSWFTVLSAARDAASVLALAVVVTVFAPVSTRLRTVLASIVVPAAVFIVVAVIQKKGWVYHLLPVVELSLIALLLVAVVLLPRLGEAMIGRGRTLAVLAAIGLETGVLFVRPAYEMVHEASRARYAERPFITTLRRLVAGRSYLLIGSGYQWGIPSMIDGTLAARQPGQVLLPGTLPLAAGDARQRATAARLQSIIVSELVSDLERYRPVIVAVDTNEQKQALPDNFDLLGYFTASPEFRRVWASYERTESIPGWDFYRLRTPAG
ncbi:MAG: hypothetical protein WDN25_12445 [Acetobacteraceae bacterium]